MNETGASAGPLIRNISDTALFRDPFARRLAGSRGEQIAASMPFGDRATWAFVMRTYLYD